MAWLAEAGDLVFEGSEGIEAEEAEAAEEAEGAEGAEEQASIKREIEELKGNVSELSEGFETLKKLNLPKAEESFAEFVGKNIAIGVILYGVNMVMGKIFRKTTGGQKQELQKKQEKVKAVTQLTKDLANVLKKLAKWSKDKENVTVDVGDDITVPLPDILNKFTKPMEKVRVRFLKI